LKKKSILLLFILLSAPLVLLAVLDTAWKKTEEEAARTKFNESLKLTLKVIQEFVEGTIRTRQAHLSSVVDEEDVSPSTLREIARKEALVRTMFAVDAEGTLLFPNPNDEISDNERAFLVRTRRIFSEKEKFRRGSDNGEAFASGWYPWYWEEGLQLLFWKKNKTGVIVGAELSRAALLSEIIGELPTEFMDQGLLKNTAVVLRDENNRALHVIGEYPMGSGEEPTFTLPLEDPLSSMSLAYFVSPTVFASALFQQRGSALRPALAVLAAVLVTCAFLVFREMRRESLDAKNKVTFVNQVSHELKTPLTNIRMYAELLDMELADDDEKARGYLNVITAESERLSRLILNVLTFGKNQKQTLSIRRAACVIDEVISVVVEQLRPGLESKGFEVDLKLNLKGELNADRDAVSQILFNLIGNAEKYAADGKHLCIESRRLDIRRAVILVSDRGKGIPKKFRRKIFLPFFRIGDAAAEGKSGTGIGLSVSRELARLHGGDIHVLPCDKGATFEVTLAV
jgi:signal transduction histidine kinase